MIRESNMSRYTRPDWPSSAQSPPLTLLPRLQIPRKTCPRQLTTPEFPLTTAQCDAHKSISGAILFKTTPNGLQVSRRGRLDHDGLSPFMPGPPRRTRVAALLAPIDRSLAICSPAAATPSTKRHPYFVNNAPLSLHRRQSPRTDAIGSRIVHLMSLAQYAVRIIMQPNIPSSRGRKFIPGGCAALGNAARPYSAISLHRAAMAQGTIVDYKALSDFLPAGMTRKQARLPNEASEYASYPPSALPALPSRTRKADQRPRSH